MRLIANAVPAPRGALPIGPPGGLITMPRSNGQAPGNGMKLGVLLAIFDFPMLNVGLREVIDAAPDMEVIGEVESRETMSEEMARTGADVVIAESLPFDRPGAPRSSRSSRSAPPGRRTQILALECRSRGEQFSLAIKAGADGYLTREAAAADVVTALRCVARGQRYVSPAIVTRMVNTYVLRSPDGPLADPFEKLSEREREVMLLAAIGHTNREIARTFHL